MVVIESSNRIAINNQKIIQELAYKHTETNARQLEIEERLAKLEEHHHTYVDSNARLFRGKQLSTHPTSEPTYRGE